MRTHARTDAHAAATSTTVTTLLYTLYSYATKADSHQFKLKKLVKKNLALYDEVFSFKVLENKGIKSYDK